jgi:hypothetical protein
VGREFPLLIDDAEGVAYTSPLIDDWHNLDEKKVNVSSLFPGIGKLTAVEDRYNHFKVHSAASHVYQVTNYYQPINHSK